MKHYLLGFATLLLYVLNISSAHAGRVERSKIDQVAQNWYRHYAPESKKQAVITKSIPYKFNGRECFHIVSFDKGGFVLVSANDAVMPVLGYGFDFPVPDSITNEAVKGWFDRYARQIDTVFVLNLQSDASTSKWNEIMQNSFPKAPGNTVGPLVTTNWGQGWPYNSLCPADPGGPGGHVWAGCVATAMAQILKYHNYPDQGLGSYGYTFSPYPYTSADFGVTTYNWTNMPESISDVNNDIATLIYHTAVSCSAMWGSENTGVWFTNTNDPMSFAFVNFFRMAFSSMKFVERQNYTEMGWDSIMQTELLNSRPVYYRGDGVGSHAFVCDGKDNNNLYHFNWGWDGMLNGYFSLATLNPGFYNFSSNQMAIIGIKPNDGSTLVSDTTWAGNLVMENPVAIPVSISVTINPGTTISCGQDCKIQVYGKLTSIGTADNNIRFTAIDTTSGWQGIKFDNNYFAARVPADSNDITKLIYTQVEYSKSHGIDSRWGKLLIEKCKIHNNKANVGAGIFIMGYPIKISKSEIYHNQAAQGGGIYLVQIDSLNYANQTNEISENDIFNNYATDFGGGLFFEVANNVLVKGNAIYQNYAMNGAGLSTDFSSIKIMNNKFYNNIASGYVGGTLTLCYESRNIVINNLLSNNGSSGVSCFRSSAFILNNTIANNAGAGIWFFYTEAKDVNIKNSIIYGNSTQINLENDVLDPVIDHCDIQGGFDGFVGSGAGANYNVANYTNNIDCNPLFVNPSPGTGVSYNGISADWSLPSNSPCLDSGDTIAISKMLPALDLDSNSRINRIIDIGAYESLHALTLAPVVLNSPQSRLACENSTIILSTYIRGDSLQYEWYFNSDSIPASNNDTLIITNATSTESGNYYCVACNNHGCDTTLSANINIVQLPPLDIGEIEGPDTVTWWQQPVNDSIPYYLPSIYYCVNNQLYTTYLWSLLGRNSSSSHCKSFMAGDSDSSGIIKVRAINICGTIDSVQKYIVIKPFSPPEPYGILYGPSVVYKGENITYHLDIGNYYIEKICHLPAGFTNNWTNWWGYFNYTVNSDALSNTILETYWRKYGTVQYYEGEHIFIPITIVDSASQLPFISGPDSIISLQDTLAYSIDSLIPASSYEWVFPEGLIPANSPIGRIVEFTITPAFAGGTLKVRGINPNWRGPYYEKAISRRIRYDISGNFFYNNPANTLLDSTKILIVQNGSTIDSTFTDGTAHFRFSAKNEGIYTIDAVTTKPWSGVNGTDALKIQRHFAGLELITEPVRLQAADVNNSNSINGTDALKVKRRFAGLDTTFARGNWTFAKPVIGGDTIVVNGMNVTQDFYGLCVGDVNGSNVPSSGMKSSSGVLMSYSDTIFIQSEQEFELPVWVDQALSLSAVSLVIELPAEKIQVLDVKMNSGTVIYHMVGNELRMAWSELQPLELSQGGELLRIRMKVILSQSENEIIQALINDECELADVDARVLRGVTLKTKTIKVIGSSNAATEATNPTLTILPNPNSGEFRVQVSQAVNGFFTLSLFDNKGVQIKTLNKIQFTSGLSGNIDFKGILTGVYYLKMKNDSTEFTGKIIFNNQ